MGCTNSNVRTIKHPEIPVEERIIQAAERLITFNKKKFEEVLELLKNITFPITMTHHSELCQLLTISLQSPPGIFLENLITNSQITSKQLKNITILLSDSNPTTKLSLITSSDKISLLTTVSELFHLSVDIIPKNLQNIDSSVRLYLEQLKPAAEGFIRQINQLSIEEIKDLLKEVGVSSKEIRIKMFVLSKTVTENLDLKLGNFQNDNRKRDEDVAQVIETNESEKEIKGVERNELEGLCKVEDHEKNTDEIKVQDKIEEKSDFQESLKTPEAESEVFIKIEKEHSTEHQNDTSLEDRNELKCLLEKIPDEFYVDFNLSECSASGSFNESSLISPFRSDSLIKQETSEETEFIVHTEPRKKSVVELYIERAKNSNKSPEKLAESPAKIPLKPCLNIVTHLKAIEALSNPIKKSATQEKILTVKSLRPSILLPSRTGEVKEGLSETGNKGKLQPSLSESSILRSKIQKLSESKGRQEEPVSERRDSEITIKSN